MYLFVNNREAAFSVGAGSMQWDPKKGLPKPEGPESTGFRAWTMLFSSIDQHPSGLRGRF